MTCVRSGPMKVSDDINTSKEGEELLKEDRRCDLAAPALPPALFRRGESELGAARSGVDSLLLASASRRSSCPFPHSSCLRPQCVPVLRPPLSKLVQVHRCPTAVRQGGQQRGLRFVLLEAGCQLRREQEQVQELPLLAARGIKRSGGLSPDGVSLPAVWGFVPVAPWP